ncbi:hypothetical protein KW494_19425 [Vibrio fluvialis]|uniref:hypothetical protein n=1 Tax=Vibrio fluvialis TaxID=676 RepID=UPI00056E3A92|nr:hypothetical protein [Vibrio fluvialis]EMC0407470.1 hypothetical protein [Vibrio fluvialis]MBL4245427.1 hypothetical protein [Vibrio fluvialis]MBL4254364.1 hypothetical protein [Vibrio fluvialis]MBY8113485.1 hypothetical protein [Vibrio fluvialis]MBY8296684.1 hypothetical protein [Vibrio fluvialis]
MKAPANLVNSLAAWNSGAGISLSDWILCVGNYDHFIAYSRLVWPEFIEYGNRIYIADLFNQENIARNIENGANEYQAQCFQNAIDLSTIFSTAQESYDEEKLLYLANVLKSSWSASLALNYPEREFSVFIDNCLDEENVGDLMVSFGEKGT